ncbi:hypothetical protein D6V22_07995 [Vibrio cholerae]|nr:hypothetical protein DA89_697 [Vibrio paracholerae]MVC41637.1 hypothetical protein [Vibrio cholerae]
MLQISLVKPSEILFFDKVLISCISFPHSIVGFFGCYVNPLIVFKRITWLFSRLDNTNCLPLLIWIILFVY